MSEPIVFGDARNIVAVLHLSKEGLEDLAHAFSPSDGFSRECYQVLEQVYRGEEAEERDDKATI